MLWIPSLLAPKTFYLTPPIFETWPERLISPVIATDLLAGLSRAREIKVEVIAIPAEGPYFGTLTPTKFKCMSFLSKKLLLKYVLRMKLAYEKAISLLYLITVLRFPVIDNFPSFFLSSGI